jgi:signal transduction histidine kinase
MTHDPLARRMAAEAPAPVEAELQLLSYAVAHDLSASVRYMTTFSRLIAAEARNGAAQRQNQYADQLRLAGDQCGAMLQQLLAYSHVQSRELVPTLHDPGLSARAAWLRLAAAARAEAAEIAIAPLDAVEADADLLAQAISALLDNAIKFRRPDVALRVVVEPAHDDAYWRIHVRDNGIGVDVRYREAAFAMFRRLNGGDVYPGVGAGLAICRRIARRHGGEARFVDCSEGACVELVVPRMTKRPRRRARTAS